MATNYDNSNSGAPKAITINRTLNLPLNTVWKAFSEPESFKKWWGPKDYSCPVCYIDFKVGGKCRASMKGPDGNETWSVGTYKEITPLKKIVVTDNFADSEGNVVPASYYNMGGDWPEQSLITLTFEEVDAKTSMALVHDGIPVEMHDDCIEGWQQSLDKLDNNLK